jgi:His-Xaa-Ser system radical SAM maturase HxsC
MIQLHSRGEPDSVQVPIVGVVRWARDSEVLGVYKTREEAFGEAFAPRAVVRTRVGTAPSSWSELNLPTVIVEDSIQPLSNGDVISLTTSGRVDTMFRGGSDHNSLFVTEQCNSYCLMCSQPPRRVDDLEHFLTLNARAVGLMPKDVRYLGITGGEPTLLGTRLADLVKLCRSALPDTYLTILSNGRRFADGSLANAIAATADDHVLFTIPLYADNELRHDYIVQASGAFNETVMGFYNLAALGVRSEVRVVLHRESVDRLPQLARFIQNNLPFVEQVAFMGLEMTGLARANEDLLWIEPPEYMPGLFEAIDHLSSFGIRASIYNLPRCVVPKSLWPFLRLSISDWKREYLPACSGCSERNHCGGLFGTSSRLSLSLRPFSS